MNSFPNAKTDIIVSIKPQNKLQKVYNSIINMLKELYTVINEYTSILNINFCDNTTIDNINVIDPLNIIFDNYKQLIEQQCIFSSLISNDMKIFNIDESEKKQLINLIERIYKYKKQYNDIFDEYTILYLITYNHDILSKNINTISNLLNNIDIKDKIILKTIYYMVSNLYDLILNKLILNLPQLTTKIYNKITLLSDKSVQGIIYNLNINNLSELYVLKTTKNSQNNIDLLHEYFIGLQINKLRETIPNFIYTFYGFSSGDIYKTDESKLYDKPEVNNILLEKINGKTLKNADMNLYEYFNCYIQLACALYLAYEKFKFTHYDLHHDNVIIRKLDKYVNLKYKINGKDIYIYTDKIYTIIDYGFSYININNTNYGVYDFINHDIYPDKPNIYFDFNKLLNCNRLMMFNLIFDEAKDFSISNDKLFYPKFIDLCINNSSINKKLIKRYDNIKCILCN